MCNSQHLCVGFLGAVGINRRVYILTPCLDLHHIGSASCWWNQQAVKQKQKNPATFQIPPALDSRSFPQELGEGLSVTQKDSSPRPLHPSAATKPLGCQDGDEKAMWGQLCWTQGLEGSEKGPAFHSQAWAGRALLPQANQLKVVARPV